MAKIALYQKYRSSTFEEVIGQEHIVRSIKNAVRENRVGHAYLFCGPRGTGKTTMARLLAKAVNCENPDQAPCNECANCKAANAGTHPDIIEINAANETHVDDIRDLIDRSTLAPMQGKHKVYIIDEVHQLSSAASSALLKTLEEPPENVIFILATTDPQKLLPTIISRCQRYDFTRITTPQIRDHLLDIAQKENIRMEPEAAEMIAELADGGMRDSLSIMDQCASYTNDNITAEDIDRIYGLTTAAEKEGLLKDIYAKDLESMLKRIRSYEQKGIDLQRFTDGMIDILKDQVIYAKTGKKELLSVLSEDEAKEMNTLCDPGVCMPMAEKLIDAKQKFRIATSPTTAFEVVCLDLATGPAVITAAPAAVRSSAPVKNEQKASVTVNPVHANNVTNTITQNSTAQSSVSVTEEPAKEEPAMPLEEAKVLSTDEVLSILVSCNKTEKAVVEALLNELNNHVSLKDRKYTSLLGSAQLAAAGKDCILLESGEQAVANRINAPDVNEELYFFLKANGIDRMVYAVSKTDFRTAANAFRTAMKNHTLPEPKQVVRYIKKEEEKKDDPLSRTLKLFGADQVEVIEGEENNGSE